MGLDFHHIHYLLSQACLGEITPNFSHIYWGQTGNLIQVYFYLEKANDNDIEAIKFEIMSLFELWVADGLEANNLPNNYQFEAVILIESDYLPVSHLSQKLHSIFRKSDR